jgi:hypothetical protein
VNAKLRRCEFFRSARRCGDDSSSLAVTLLSSMRHDLKGGRVRDPGSTPTPSV